MTSAIATLEEARERAKAKTKAEGERVAAAFAAVFGQPRKRSEAQKIVMDYLERGCSIDTNDFDFSKDWDGFKTALAAADMNGGKSTLRIIHRQLRKAALVRE